MKRERGLLLLTLIFIMVIYCTPPPEEKLTEMGFFEKVWHQHKIIVIIGVIIIILILLVLKMAFAPSSTDRSPDEEEMVPISELMKDKTTIKRDEIPLSELMKDKNTIKQDEIPSSELMSDKEMISQEEPPFTEFEKDQETIPEEEIPVVEIIEEKSSIMDTQGTHMDSDNFGTVTVLVRDQQVGAYTITSGGLIVGRDPSQATIHLPYDKISKKHVKIIPKREQFFLIDLGSTNGTYVNGERITETTVSEDDLIQLGKRGDIKLILKKK